MQGSQSRIFIAVAGNIGCGKSTLTKRLSESLELRPQYESVDDNPYLTDFYGDMKKYSFPLQVYFLTHRFNTHRMIESANYSCVQDRTIYEDAHIFARALFESGVLCPRDYKNYLSLYETMVNLLNPPTLMIYLKRSVPKLMERIHLRARDCEKQIPQDYIARLNGHYDEWFENYKHKSLVVDTDNLDFMENQKDYDRLIAKIHESIEQQDLFYTYH